ncbi:MAG TPA: MFS transporter [Hanamia sp.]|nr:MFS transporter [Hanamia sp.]
MYNRKIVFWAACIGILFFGMGITTLGSVKHSLEQKYLLDEIASGTLFSILPFGIVTGSLLFGPFCDKYGYKVLLAITCLSMFAGFEGIAYSPTQALLKLSIFLFGIGGGAINGATNALVSDISEKNKGANLSLLGVFYGIGALGMPFLLGILENKFNYEVVLSVIGWAALAVGIFFLITKFPPPKQAQHFPVAKSFAFFRDSFLILIAFFLFCQSSFEAIINNWTTTYLSSRLGVPQNKALYALSLFVAGMTVMRFLLGSVFRNTPLKKIWIGAFSMIFLGLIFLFVGKYFFLSISGLILLGGGLAVGFPLMLGLVGDRYKEISGTAFSFVFVIALLGNMLINYGMGIVAQVYGIQHLITVAFIELIVMVILCYNILSGKRQLVIGNGQWAEC